KDSMGLLWFVIIGAVAGWLAGQFMKGHGLGLVGDIPVGTIGAFIARFLLRSPGVEPGHGPIGRLIVAFRGAVLPVLLVRLLPRPFSPRRSPLQPPRKPTPASACS